MDITQWLQRTAEAQDDDGTKVSKDDTDTAHRCAKARGAKRASSPSIIGVTQVRAPKDKEKRRRHKRKVSSSNHSSSDDTSTCSSADHTSSDGPASSARSERFERRKRHKTKEDKYEPYAKEGKKRSKKKDKDGRKEKHRRTEKKRKQANKPGLNLVNNFSADNVRNNRLTLQPGASVGLFHKGRASSPVRRGGLPDLVFSEMKFLQKPREQPEPSLNQESTNKSKKRKTRQDTEAAEVSAFFNQKRPALTSKDVNRGTTADTSTTTTYCPMPRSHVDSVATIEDMDRRTAAERSANQRTALPHNPSKDADVESPHLFGRSNVVLPGKFEQPLAHPHANDQTAEVIKSAKVSPKAQDLVSASKEVPGPGHARSAPSPLKQLAHHCDHACSETGLRPRTEGDRTKGTAITPRHPRPSSSPVAKLLSACDHAAEQGKKASTHLSYRHGPGPQYHEQPQIQQDLGRIKLPTTLQYTRDEATLSGPRMSHAGYRYMDCHTHDRGYSVPAFHYQGQLRNVANEQIIMRDFDLNLNDTNRHQRIDEEPYVLPSVSYTADFAPHYGHEDYANVPLWDHGNQRYVEQQERGPYVQLQRQQTAHDVGNGPQYPGMSSHDRVLYHSPVEYFNQHYMSSSNHHPYEQFAGTARQVLERASHQQLIEDEDYEQLLADDEAARLQDELDHELYGTLDGHGRSFDEEAETGGVVPSGFWRPRRLY